MFDPTSSSGLSDMDIDASDSAPQPSAEPLHAPRANFTNTPSGNANPPPSAAHLDMSFFSDRAPAKAGASSKPLMSPQATQVPQSPSYPLPPLQFGMRSASPAEMRQAPQNFGQSLGQAPKISPSSQPSRQTQEAPLPPQQNWRQSLARTIQNSSNSIPQQPLPQQPAVNTGNQINPILQRRSVEPSFMPPAPDEDPTVLSKSTPQSNIANAKQPFAESAKDAKQTQTENVRGAKPRFASQVISFVLMCAIGGIVFASLYFLLQKQNVEISAIRNDASAQMSVLKASVAALEKKAQGDGDKTLTALKTQLEENTAETWTKLEAIEKEITRLKQEVGMAEYSSRHNFRIAYPSYWYVDSPVERYNTLFEAQSAGQNKFIITSYSQDAYQSGVVPQNQVKIEVWLDGALNRTLAEWVSSLGNIMKVEDIAINDNPAQKVWRTIKDGTSKLSIYYVDGSKGAIFNHIPANSAYSSVFDAVVASFRFK